MLLNMKLKKKKLNKKLQLPKKTTKPVSYTHLDVYKRQGLVFPIAIQAWKYELPLTGGNLLALFGLVFIGTVFAYTVFLKGTTMVGAIKGSLLASVEPVASVILTVLIMGDHFFAIDVLGMILIVLAVILISLKDLVALKKQEKIQR